jgi:hypothetical protein
MNGCQFAVFTYAAPKAMNSSTTATLIITMVALALADSRIPTTSSAVTRSAIRVAGTLKIPWPMTCPAVSVIGPRGLAQAAGKLIPKSCRKLTT